MPTAQEKAHRLERLIALYGTDDVEEIARALGCSVNDVTLDHLPNMGGDGFGNPPLPLVMNTTTDNTQNPLFKLWQDGQTRPLHPPKRGSTIGGAALEAAVAAVVDGLKGPGLRK